MSQPCNICGVEWPDHVESCAYVYTTRERDRFRIALQDVQGIALNGLPNADTDEARISAIERRVSHALDG